MSDTTKSISIVTVLLMISRIFGFIREMVIAAYYGATHQTDAYNMAVIIMGLSTAVISAGIATVIIPMYNHRRIQKSKENADLFASNILCITSVFYLCLSIAGIIFAPALVKIFAPNFDENTIALTVDIIKMTFVFTVIINISNFMASIAQIHNKFSITIVANFPFSVFTVVSVICFADKVGIYALVIGYIMFLVTQVFLLALSARKVFKFRFKINFKNGDLKEVLKLSLPIYLSVAIWEINIIIDKVLASGLSEGSISLLTYASRLRSLPDGIITASVITVMFPLLSKYAAEREFAKLKEATTKAISLLFMALLPVISICVYYAEEITKIVYERGVFTPEQTALTANIFTISVVSLIFSGVAGLLSNLFYSVQDTKTPQIAAVVTLVSNIAFNLIFVKYLQLTGLALATSIASLVYFIVSFIQFGLKFGGFGIILFLKNIYKYVLAAAGMVPLFFVCEILRGKLPLLPFFTIVLAVSLCFYAFLLYLLKAELFMESWIQIKKLKTNKNNIQSVGRRG